jgi:hypothetical protein
MKVHIQDRSQLLNLYIKVFCKENQLTVVQKREDLEWTPAGMKVIDILANQNILPRIEQEIEKWLPGTTYN